MRTTIDIPDELFRRVKIKAAEDGARLKDLVAHLIERGLEAPPTARSQHRQRRSPPPVIWPATGHPIPAMSNAEINRVLEDEDVQQYFTSLD